MKIYPRSHFNAKKTFKAGDTVKAYSFINVKNLDATEMVIEGIASTPSVDRENDIIDPLGAEFADDIALLWQHNHGQPVGRAQLKEPTADGIGFNAQLTKIDEEGELKNLVTKAWQAVKYGLVRAVSIGFRILDDGVEYSPEIGGFIFKKIEIYELSLVTIPANMDATIDVVRSLAEKSASAQSRTKPGVSGKSKGVTYGVKLTPKTKEIPMGKHTDILADYQKTKNNKLKEMDDLQDAAHEAGATMDEAQTEVYDALDAEVESIDKDIERIQRRISRDAETARPVVAGTPAAGAKSRTPARAITVTRNLRPGTMFARYAMALAKSKGQLGSAVAFAESHTKSGGVWNDTPEVARVMKMQMGMGGKIDLNVIKAPVSIGTTTDSSFASDLVDFTTMTSEFVGLTRPQTIVGRIQGLRRIPFLTRINGQTSGGTAGWVGEAQMKPVTSPGFNSANHGFNKLAGICVFSDELARWADPAVEGLVIDDLRGAITQRVDTDFVDFANAGVANIKPASITNGLTPVPASGTTGDDLEADINALLIAMVTANISPTSAVILMNPLQAINIGSIRNALGAKTFPDITMNGGTLMGMDVITSTAIVAGQISVIVPSEIYLSDDDGIAIDVSTEASVFMSDDPNNDTPVTMTSLWQQNLVGVRVERYMNWSRRRNAAAQIIGGAAYK